jgi:hypothetical protein
MITATGYSKDRSIIPEGIMLTLPVQFFEDRKWDYKGFIKMFERYMAREDSLRNFRLTNLPLHEVLWIYLVFDKHVQFRTNMVMYERNVSKSFNDGPDRKCRNFPNANWVILSGPAIRPPYECPQKGFQGFRYTTKLF